GLRAPSVTRPGGGEKKRAATDRGDARHAADRPRYDVGRVAARKLRAHAGIAADRDERVDAGEASVGELGECQIGDQPDAGGRREWAGLRRRDLDAIGLARQLVI